MCFRVFILFSVQPLELKHHPFETSSSQWSIILNSLPSMAPFCLSCPWGRNLIIPFTVPLQPFCGDWRNLRKGLIVKAWMPQSSGIQQKSSYFSVTYILFLLFAMWILDLLRQKRAISLPELVQPHCFLHGTVCDRTATYLCLQNFL